MEFQDHDDILGRPTLPIVPADTGSPYFTVTKSIFALVFFLGLYVVGMRIRREVLIWREKAYKLENRRRHGIPDTDRRPFNVAYAAARRDREEGASQKLTRALSRPTPQPNHPEEQHRANTREPQGLTNRSNRLRSATSMPLPGAFVPTYLTAPAPRPDSVAPRPLSTFNDHSESRTSTRRHEAEPDFPGDVTSEGDLTRDAVWGEDESPHKMSDIDEDMEWVPSGINHHKRSAKRPLSKGDEAEEQASDEGEGVREKRQRKVSLDHSVTMVEDDMEVDEDEYEDDDVPDITWPVVGSKRGRADAASTFGDDSENEDTKSTRRHRKKRQTGSRRQSAIGAFDSKKRGREEDEPTPSEAGTLPRRSKKNRKAIPEDIELWSISSSGRRPRKRQIGEEWESNGIRYKIGPNGQRLRQALVKKARSKFTMPKDSNHPDRNANLEVYVETWLSEAEYKEARENRLLAWQDSPKYSNEPENISIDTSTARSTPSRPGKNLLWQSTNNTPLGSPIVPGSPLDSPSIRPKGVRTPGRYSLGGVVPRVNPFEKPASSSVRRIVSSTLGNSVSASSTSSSGLSDKTNGKESGVGGDGTAHVRPRNLSKWEKQEVEAQAIARLRALKQAESDAAEKEKREKERVEKERLEKVEKERLEKVENERKEKERKEKEAAAAAPPKIPTITVTQPSTDSTKPASSGFSFGPAPSTSGTAPASSATTPAAPSSNLFGAPTSSSAAPAEPPKAGAPSFSFNKPAAPAATSAPTAAPSGFSFGPPSSTTSKAPSPLFGPPSTEKKDQTSQPSAVLFGQPAAPAASDASKASSTPAAAPLSTTGFTFGPAPAATGTASNLFGKPSATTPAASTTPAAGAPPANKFNFGFGPSKSTEPSGAAPASSSLAGALGGGAPSAPGVAASTSSTTGSTPSFSFNTTAATAPALGQEVKSGFVFGPCSGGTRATSLGSGSVFGAPAASPFGVTTPTPAAATPAAASTSSTPFSFGATLQDKGKETAKPAATGFGTTGTMNVFGGGAANGTGAASAFGAPAGGAAKNPFGVSGGSSSTPAFVTTTTNGTASSAFGKPANGASELPKFSFGGATNATTTNTTTTPKTTSGSGFTFGTTATTTPAGNPPAASTSAPATGSSTMPFNFGFGKTAGGGTAAPATNGGSVFGAPTTSKSVFGAPSTTTPTTTPTATGGAGLFGATKPLSAFGAPPTNGAAGAPGPTTPAGTPFSFGK